MACTDGERIDAERAASRELRHPRNTDLAPQLVWRGKDYGDSGRRIDDHFVDVTEMVDRGSGSRPEIDDPRLRSRSAQEPRRSWDTCGSPAKAVQA
jgi:hypothetical protein